MSGSQGTVVGSTSITGSKDVAQFWIQGADIVGPDEGQRGRGLLELPGWRLAD